MADPHTMHSMELDDEDQLDFTSPIPMPSPPQFPPGLRICLTEKECEKAKIDAEGFEVGALVHGFFMARVTSISKNESEADSSCRIEIQIEDLGIESEDEENE